MELEFEKYLKDQYCDNEKCEYYGMLEDGNIKIHSKAHRQVYCNHCRNRWVLTKNTFFYNLKTPVNTVLECLILLSEGMGLRATSRSKGVSVDSLLSWILKAGHHVNELNAVFKAEMNLTQCQIDEFWSFIQKKKET